jgi:hypothetical protein
MLDYLIFKYLIEFPSEIFWAWWLSVCGGLKHGHKEEGNILG